MKKVLSLVLVIAMLALAGCAGAGSANVKIGQVQYAAHGTKSFAVATVAMSGDKIAAAYMDEYQFVAKDGNTGVPNSDADFGTGVADPDRVLASKRLNNDSYSKNMSEKGGATQPLLTSWQAIEKYVTGKTVAELESAISGKDAAAVVDAVTGSTLVDTKGYIEAFIAAAKAAK